MKNSKSFCITCKKNFCCHAEYIEKCKHSTQEIPDLILKMTDSSAANAGIARNSSWNYAAVSTKRISFNGTADVSVALKRLLNIGSRSCLAPDNYNCCGCVGAELSEVVQYDDCCIITTTSIETIRGIHRLKRFLFLGIKHCCHYII